MIVNDVSIQTVDPIREAVSVSLLKETLEMDERQMEQLLNLLPEMGIGQNVDITV